MYYFTIRYMPSGLADRLGQHHALYSVGKSLGLGYLYSNFDIEDDHLPENRLLKVSDFLGFYIDETSVDDEKFKQCERAEIDVSKLIEKLKTPEKIRQHLDTGFGRGNDAIFIFSWGSKYHAGEDREFLVSYLLKLDRNAFAYNFPEKFEKADKARLPLDLKLPFENGKKNIALHIRRGDNCLFPFKDRYIWNKTGDIFGTKKEALEWLEKNYPHRRYVEIYRFEDELRRLIHEHGEDALRVAVFSDGYKNAAHYLKKSQKVEFSGMDDERCYCVLSEYERREFAALSKYKNVELYIGETEELYFKAIYAFMTCDIVIRDGSAFAEIQHYFRRRHPAVIDLSK